MRNFIESLDLDLHILLCGASACLFNLMTILLSLTFGVPISRTGLVLSMIGAALMLFASIDYCWLSKPEDKEEETR